MKVTYTYKVTSVDKNNNCAEVLYESDNLPSHLVSVRFPFEDETFLDVIEMHAPIYQWSLLTKKVKDMEVGMTGVVNYEEKQIEEPVTLRAPITKVEVIG